MLIGMWEIVYLSPAEWNRQAEWIKTANIHFLKHCKKYFGICNATIFALHTLGVKLCFHPWNDHIKDIKYTFTLKHGPDTKVHI